MKQVLRALLHRLLSRRNRHRALACSARILRALPVSVAALVGVATGFALALTHPLLASNAICLRRVAAFAAMAGSPRFAMAACRGASASRSLDVLRVVHELAVAGGNDGLAFRTEGRIASVAGDDERRLATARRLLQRHRPNQALAVLDAFTANRDEVAPLLAGALYAAGRFTESINAAPSTPSSTEDWRRRIEMEWALSAAPGGIAIEPLLDSRTLNSPALLSTLAAARPDTVPILIELARASVQQRAQDADAGLAAAFLLGDIDFVLESGDPDDFGPIGRHTIASARYVRRDFDASRAALPGTLGTVRHWDSEKLESRMRLEEGDVDGALRLRRGRTRLPSAFDEVRHYALLHLGRLEEAFSSFLAPDDELRMRSEFDATFESHIVDRCAHRFVVMLDGPGDELLYASTYAVLAEMSDRLSVTCDPRLQTLLARSMPEIDFVPVERLRGRICTGALAPDRPPRARGSLFRLLTEDAHHRALSCERVTTGRALPRLVLQAGPRAGFLVPCAEHKALAERTRGTIGLAWRSELMDPMRRIHYLSVADLRPLAALPHRYTCFQHDVTTQERSVLIELFGDQISFVDDMDLRNDFESLAALIAGCHAFVGVGTTTTELAAALGTFTVEMHPSNWATWRDRGDGSDWWHRSMRLACATSFDRPASCVQAALDILSSYRPARDVETTSSAGLGAPTNASSNDR